MCYSVLSEIHQVQQCEKSRQLRLPKPYYLFVQKYGRSLEQEMPEIAKALGNGKWFSFGTEGKKKEVSITSRFLLELEKYAEIGKPFQGCVLVELTGQEESKELFEFLSYIRQKNNQFCCVFSTRALECAKDLQEALEQHFFVRVIDGEAYGSEEQKGLFLDVLNDFGFVADESVQAELEQVFLNVLWEEEDMVQNKIENLARNMVYEKMLQTDAKLLVTMEEIREATAVLKREPEKLRRIGFVQGEWSYE